MVLPCGISEGALNIEYESDVAFSIIISLPRGVLSAHVFV